MSKIPPLRCLFCNLRNPASAKYCNDCASPLHLQPCNQCGAIDNRVASTCYKCGTQFNVHAAPKRARVSVASKRARAPAASELVPVPAPPLPEHQIAKPTLNDSAFAIERAFPSKSPAQVVGIFRQGLRREVTETQGQAVRDADRAPTLVNSDPAHPAAEPQPMVEAVASESVQSPDLAHFADEPPLTDKKAVAHESVQNSDRALFAVESLSVDETIVPETVQYPVLALSAVEPQRMDETVEFERAMTAITSRRARHFALATLLLATTAVSAYYYYDRTERQPAQAQGAGQPTSIMPSPISVGASTATVAMPVDATSTPKNATSQSTTSAEEVEKAPPPAAPVVAKEADARPVPANQPLNAPPAANRPTAMPQAASAALIARRQSVIDAGVTSRKDPPIINECTEPVAALGLCSPSK